MKQYHEKILKIAEIFGVNPDTIIMTPDSFTIEETYCDKTGQTHYRIVLTNGEAIIEKTKKP